MKKIFKHLFVVIFLISLLTLPYFVFAGPNPLEVMKDTADSGGYEVETTDENTLARTLGIIVNAFLGFLGIIFIILIIWAGYNWMTAGGNEDKVSKARTTIIRAVIGLIIVLASYAIWYVIFVRIVDQLTS